MGKSQSLYNDQSCMKKNKYVDMCPKNSILTKYDPF